MYPATFHLTWVAIKIPFNKVSVLNVPNEGLSATDISTQQIRCLSFVVRLCYKILLHGWLNDWVGTNTKIKSSVRHVHRSTDEMLVLDIELCKTFHSYSFILTIW